MALRRSAIASPQRHLSTAQTATDYDPPIALTTSSESRSGTELADFCLGLGLGFWLLTSVSLFCSDRFLVPSLYVNLAGSPDLACNGAARSIRMRSRVDHAGGRMFRLDQDHKAWQSSRS